MPTYGDLIVNGSFANGMTGWWAGAPAMITTATPGTHLEATASTDAVNLWDAPVGQDAIELRAGVRYTLSFTARASQPGAVLRVQVGLGAAPWTAAVDKTVTLTKQFTQHVVAFVSPLTSTAGQVSFQLGQSAPVTISLTEVALTCSTVREGIYSDPDSNAARWVAANPTDPRAPLITRSLAQRPGARWFGDWTVDVEAAVAAYVTAAADVGKLPLLTAYNIHRRDNGGASGGGAQSAAEYRAWITSFAAGIGGRPALVVVEPDSLAQAEALPPSVQDERYSLVAYAAQTLAGLPRVATYLDGGNATWLRPEEQATRLVRGGVAHARGFALGVANFHATDISCTYGQQITRALAAAGVPGAQFVIDTGRNGNGALSHLGENVDWCNPGGRRLGVRSGVGVGGAEYLLWIKVPGDSDGPCGVAPETPAGQFSPYLAERLITGQ
ncbi:glycoside hydrolase family 6 protein [Streptomyces uncialis]|uniref:glycoside hydrolase family 6 protein n=1 Tax=Streptomyces uncialis TaxID=1048205 RepID=UPI0037F248BA